MTTFETAEAAELRREIEREVEGLTVLGGFLQTAERCLDEEAFRWKDGSGWRALTWRDYRQAVADVAAGLDAGGFAARECAVIFSRNRPEPQIADLAVQAAGGVPVSLHTTLTAAQVADIVNHCEATVAFVDEAYPLSLFASMRDRMPSLRRVVVFDDAVDDMVELDGEWAVHWSRLRGDRVDDPAGFLAAAAARLSSDDLATLVYTSGTTGEPKGVMITQRNVRWVIAAGFRDGEPSTGERIISFLPLSTVGGRMVDHWGHVVLGGAVIHFCPDPARLFDYAREVKPTLVLGVPAVWERVHSDLNLAIDNDPDEQRRKVVRNCIEIGRQVVRLRQSGREVPAETKAAVERTRPVLRSVRALVGLEECTRAVSGGAPMDPAIIEFFEALGMFMTESWGMTELTSAVTSGGPKGTVGTAYAGVEVSLADDGEVLVRGGLVMKGYYRDPDQTAQVIDADGWLHTGDLGALDEDGQLRIVGRKKDIIVTAGGTNVAPTPIERLLQRHPLVAQACAIGDRRTSITALLTLDTAVAPAWARERGIDADEASLAAHPEVLAEVGRAVAAANTELGTHEQVRRFHLLPQPWTAESGELTPTLKVRRRVVAERYATQIAAMYGE